MDFILNGQATGSVADQLMAANFDTGVLRPFKGSDGNSYVTINAGTPEEKTIVHNAPATLRKDAWKTLDLAIVKAAKERLGVWQDLRGTGSYTIPNGLGKTVLETERVSDINDATISMDGINQGESDRPHFDILNLPLPIIHKDFQFNARQIATAAQSGSGLDTTMAEMAARQVAEQVEKLTLGVASSYKYGGGTVYGYTNYPQRLTKTITNPTAAGWTPADLVREVLQMRNQCHNAKHYGPWRLYHSLSWDEYMDDDYSAAKGEITLRERLLKLRGISSVEPSDFMSSYDIIMVQQTTDVARAVIGMDITTVQWDSHGGMQKNYKVMCILVPQLRADFNDNTGIVHASV